MMAAYYNEFSPKTAGWLRELIKAGLIADGEVDERSIVDVRSGDVRGFDQCHFFAGIGGWSYALRLAGWADDRPVWTGSCPCQRHSSAARGRHTAPDLWPAFRELVATSSPGVVFGEQVARAAGWFDCVCDDLEALGYAVGASVLPACSVGFDHARDRLFYVGDAYGHGKSGRAVYAEAPGMPGHHGLGERVVSAHGLSSDVDLLRGFGNAIVPQVAAEFIGAYLDAVTA